MRWSTLAFAGALLAGAGLAPHSISAQTSTAVPPGLRKIIPPVPTPASFVSDASKVLSAEGHAAIDLRIRELQSAGYGDIAVAIIADIGDYSPNEVSTAIYRNWKVGSVAAIGSAHRDVGALLLIVPKELAPNKKGQCYIGTGTGAEGIITDGAAASICRDVIIPFLKDRDYPMAVTAGINAIALRLKGDEGLADSTGEATPIPFTPDPGNGNPSPLWFIPGGIGAMFASMFGVKRWRRNRPRVCPKCGRQMTRLDEAADDTSLEHGQRVEEQVKSVDYDVWTCSCGERLVLPYKKLFTSYTECRECHRRTAKSSRYVLSHATTSSTGSARDTYTCKACQASWTVMVTLPRISQSSSSGGSSGGGGSSFGGSGSSSGGGGGSSY